LLLLSLLITLLSAVAVAVAVQQQITTVGEAVVVADFAPTQVLQYYLVRR
jgi:hypothetical protein